MDSFFILKIKELITSDLNKNQKSINYMVGFLVLFNKYSAMLLYS